MSLSNLPSIWTGTFWKGAAERAIKSAAQGVLWTWAVGDKVASLYQFDWNVAAYGAGGMALFSVLTSIISAPTGDSGGPSFGDAEVPAPPAP